LAASFFGAGFCIVCWQAGGVFFVLPIKKQLMSKQKIHLLPGKRGHKNCDKKRSRAGGCGVGRVLALLFL
jgi:hypothetical protein